MVSKPEQNQPDPSANDDDEAVWLDLVARLEATSSGLPDGGQRTAFDDFDPLGVARPGGRSDDGGPGERPGSGSPRDTGTPDFGPRDYAADRDDDDDGFVPAEPASLANVEPAIMLAWVGALGAPLALLLTAMFWRGAPLTAIFGLVAVFLISAGYLIFRLPASRADDDDDGAVV